MNRILALIAAAALLGGAQANAQTKMLDITYMPKDKAETVDLAPSEATGNTRNTVGTTSINQRDTTPKTPMSGAIPNR